jgi:hypothetical protein
MTFWGTKVTLRPFYPLGFTHSALAYGGCSALEPAKKENGCGSLLHAARLPQRGPIAATRPDCRNAARPIAHAARK